MYRRDFLALGISSSLCWMTHQNVRGDETGEVSWLAEVQKAPTIIPSPARPLAPLLLSPSGTPITTTEAWRVERARIRQAWMDFLGPMPTQRSKVNLEILKEDRPDGCVRQLVRYLADADELVEGYLLRPSKVTGATPAIVALHQTSQANIDEIAGVSSGEPQNLGLQLCRAGFIVFCPRCYLWQTPPKYQIDVTSTVARFRQRYPDTLGMHKMLFDAQRGIDVLESLSEVDQNRIGAVGHSLGAKEAFYLAAFDERIKAAVASEGGIGFTSTNWKDPWYLGSGIQAPEFPLNHHQLIALIAPRAFLVVGGEKGPGAADGDRSWPYIAAAQKVYELYGKPQRLGLLNHGQGHSMPPDVRQKMTEWLATYLKGKI